MRIIRHWIILNQYTCKKLIIPQVKRRMLKKITKLIFSSFDQHTLLSGTSDIIVVKWNNGQIRSSPFLVCFGYNTSVVESNNIRIYVNNALINNISFTLNKYGYLEPLYPSVEVLNKLNLQDGRNTIKFQLANQHSISAQIYLYDQDDRILVSDMDGTLTKSDACGLYSNYHNTDYLHDGYHDLIQGAYKNGYKIVWLTMRSLPMYKFSKQYVRNHTRMHGVLIMQPQQFFPAAKKQILKKTGNIKTNMLMAIKKLFPQYINPFIGGLGNRENDAIAYLAAGIPIKNIFLIDTNSNVHHLGNNHICISYRMMSKEIEKYFPKVSQKQLLKDLVKSVTKKVKSKKQQLKTFHLKLNTTKSQETGY